MEAVQEKKEKAQDAGFEPNIVAFVCEF